MSHNPIRPWRDIYRRKSRLIHVGPVAVGGGAPISVQTMTNTLTTDAKATIAQVGLRRRGRRHRPGVVPGRGSTGAARDRAREPGADRRRHPLPLRRAIEAAEAGAACLRINPGNIGKPNGCARWCGRARPRLLDAHRRERRQPREAPAGEARRALPGRDGRERPRPHPPARGQRLPRVQDQREGVGRVPRGGGLPAAGGGDRRSDPPGDHRGGRAVGGTVKSAIGLGNLLWMGIGDTIRVSLSADPVEEVRVGFEILKALGLRHRGVNIIACPSCARQGFDVIGTVGRSRSGSSTSRRRCRCRSSAAW